MTTENNGAPQFEGNVIVSNGVTFFANTVCGIVEQSGYLVTTRNLLADWGETIQGKNNSLALYEQRVAELSDALRVMIDEGTELTSNKPYNMKHMEKALELAVKTLAGQ